jgi:RHS repeat-associated protein
VKLTHYRSSFAYDALNRRTQVTDALNDLSTVVYDATGNVVNTIDALGNKGTFTFDALNRPVTSTNPLGFTTTLAYDAASNVLAVTNPRGYTTSFAYDALNQRTQTTDALNNLASVVYDATSNVLATVDPRGNRTSFSYDGLNRVIARTDALNHTTSAVYDLGGNVIKQIDALGYTTTLAYDGLHQRLSVQGPGGGIASTVYDAAGNVVNTIDPVGNKTTFAYDALNRQTQTIDARGGVTSVLYDATDNVTGLIDSVGNRSTFAYDALNRRTQETDPLNKSLTYAYDAISRLTSQTDRLGRLRNFSYDAGNRLTGETWVAGGSTVETRTFTYDANNNQLTAANGNGAYTLTYDALDRVKTTQQPFGFGMTFTYDAASNRTLVQDSLGATTTSVYDGVNRLTSRQVGGTGQTQMREDFTYTVRDQVATATRYSDAAGTQQVGVSTYSYDAAARLTNLQNGGAAGMVSNFTYTYDLASRVTSETRNGTTVSYSYDAVNQLTSDGASYSYDLNGNRTMTGYQTGTANQMTNDGVYTYTFDAEGNVTKKSKGASADTWTYTFNHANQVTGVEDRSSDGGTLVMKATYTYDANGNRLESDVWTSSSGTTTVTRFAYDGWKNAVDGDQRPYSPVGLENWDIVADFNGSNAQQTRYLRGDGIDQVLARTDANGLEWLQTDRQGSVRDVVNNAGTVLDHIDYNGFGKVVTETAPSSGGRYKYTGAEADAETGLVFEHARYYDPATGRWLEQDPIGFGAGDANLYRYAGNDPTNLADPTGLDGEPLSEPPQGAITSRDFEPVFKPSPGQPRPRGYDPRTTPLYQALMNRPSTGSVPSPPDGFNMDLFWQNVELLNPDKARTPSLKDWFEKTQNGKVIQRDWGLFTWSYWTTYGDNGSSTVVYLNKGYSEQEAARIFVQQITQDSWAAHAWQNEHAADSSEDMANWSKWATKQIASQGVLAGNLLLSAYTINLKGVNWVFTANDIIEGKIDCWTLVQIAQVLPLARGGKFQFVNRNGQVMGEVDQNVLAVARKLPKQQAVEFLRSKLHSLEVIGQDTCFAAGTPLVTPTGHKRIEQFEEGDWVLARAEKDVEGPLAAKRVEAVFVRVAPLWGVRVEGREIRTTGEHPFYVREKGWICAQELEAGDWLSSHDGRWVAVDDVYDTGAVETVYNLRVADYHTYFVGCQEWGFSVWAHNAKYVIVWTKNAGNGKITYRLAVNEPGFRDIGLPITAKASPEEVRLLAKERGIVGSEIANVVMPERPLPAFDVSRSATLEPRTNDLVRGGGSADLGDKILGAKRGTWTELSQPGQPYAGKTPHHVIPEDLRNHRVIKEIGYRMQSEFNGMLLDDTYHTSRHPGVTDAIERALDAIRLPANPTRADRLAAAQEVEKIVNASKTLLDKQTPLYRDTLSKVLGRRATLADVTEYWISQLKALGVKFD